MITLADHAEAWQRERGRECPPRNTPAWTAMYEEWIGFAFADFPDPCGDTRCDECTVGGCPGPAGGDHAVS